MARTSARQAGYGTFVVHIQHRQNGSCQGKITWTEKGRSIRFRSAWELIKLIEGAASCAEPETARNAG